MRVLLVDNCKPDEAGVTTTILHGWLRELADVHRCHTADDVHEAVRRPHDWDAVILSGSSLNMSQSLKTAALSKDLTVLLRLPDVACLGICFGMHLMAVAYGGDVERLSARHEGEARVVGRPSAPLHPSACDAHFSHQDVVTKAPPDFAIDAHVGIEGVDRVAAFSSASLARYGIQYHPECSRDERARALVPAFLRAAFGARVPVADDRRLSSVAWARIALRMGRVSPHALAAREGLGSDVIVAVWTAFRAQFRIPALLW